MIESAKQATKQLNYHLRKLLIVTRNWTDEDDYNYNPCRMNNTIYRIIDYCLADEELGIKKGILKNGPVIAQMTVYTDFFTYKYDSYHRSEDSFKFNGQSLLRLLVGTVLKVAKEDIGSLRTLGVLIGRRRIL